MTDFPDSRTTIDEQWHGDPAQGGVNRWVTITIDYDATIGRVSNAGTATGQTVSDLTAAAYTWATVDGTVIGSHGPVAFDTEFVAVPSFRILNDIAPVSWDDANGGIQIRNILWTGDSAAATAPGQYAEEDEQEVGRDVRIHGIATEDQTLTASLADEDGVSNLAYQWKRDGVAINGAIASSYTLVQADVGKPITVTASYTDAQGTAESVTSDPTALVANVNDDPTGAVIITGNATEGQTLTVSNNLGDDDGIGNLAYQWKRDGVAINGATNSTYTLVQADVGKPITVTASYTDVMGTAESVTSDPTALVANVTISGIATEDQTLTASLADEDGVSNLTYQWKRNGVAIDGAASSTYTLVQADVGLSITVTISYLDDQGTPESMTSHPAGPVANVNDDPTGAVIITGNATEGQTLTVSNNLADEDGIGELRAFIWKRDGVAINGATNSTYTLVQADVGKPITVTASYTDAQGTVEYVHSFATAPVANVNDIGVVTISGIATEDQTLTASLADEDGVSDVTYQWKRGGVVIGGAIESSYTLVPADVGEAITVTASYTDDQGSVESMTSDPTAPVALIIVAEDFTNEVDYPLDTDISTLSQWTTNGIPSPIYIKDFYIGQEDETFLSGLSTRDPNGTARNWHTTTWAGMAGVPELPKKWTFTASVFVRRGSSSIGTANAGIFFEGGPVVGYRGTSYGLRFTRLNGMGWGFMTDFPDSRTTIDEQWHGDPAQGGVNRWVTITIDYDATIGRVSNAGTATGQTVSDLTAAAYTWATVDGTVIGSHGPVAFDTEFVAVPSFRILNDIAPVSWDDANGGIQIRNILWTGDSAAATAPGQYAEEDEQEVGRDVRIHGIATEDQTLTASLADEDGVSNLAYQWKRDGVAINGAIASSYTLVQADVGKPITVTASYTDAQRAAASVTSDPTALVANVNDDPTGAVTDDAPADICFPAGTPITTDQGAIAIEKLIPGIHTIKEKPIVGISQTKSFDNHLLCFEKHALGHNIPTQQTIMSREHCILYKGKMKRACTFMRYARIRKVKYTGETLYNVILEKHGSMAVNNMTVETLHPKHWVAKKILRK